MHMIEEPEPLHTIENIPITVSDMVLKLMAKDVDSRYKSTKGIMHDMDLIMSECNPGVEMVLAQHDIPEVPLLPQQLYGRRSEFDTLLSAYKRVALSSSPELVFVQGSSGMGKSALVMELNKHVRRKMFICGKYDSSKYQPYSGLIESISMFCDLLALEDACIIDKYRLAIQGAVQEEGRLLTNVMDKLKNVIGEQSEVFEIYGSEAKHRFNHVFIKFIKAVASVSCPLVILLEDLQWVDAASIQLIKALIGSSINNLMLIGNYRHGEINDNRELIDFLQSVGRMDMRSSNIKLGKIDHESINQFLGDALGVPPIESLSLATFIYKKTKGNPLFVKQLVNDLIAKEMITYNHLQRKWTWDDSIFNGRNIAEDVKDLLVQKIKSFDKFTKQALVIACCLGGKFSLSSLRLIIKDEKGVDDALAKGMIIQCTGSDMGCFAHDQVKDAAKSFLPEDPKKVYLHVARKLRMYSSAGDLKENIDTVANLFDRAKDIIDKEERLDVANLFLLAGEKAMTSCATDVAFDYFKSSVQLLEENDWKTNYELAFNVYCNAAKSAYCLTNYKYMNKYIDKIFKNVDAPLDLVAPYLLLIRMNSDKRMENEALSNASTILHKLEESIDPNQTITSSDILRTKNLVQQPIESLLEMKKMEDRRLLSVMEVLNAISYVSFKSGNRQVFASLTIKMVQLTVNHGISKYSSVGFGNFAALLRRIKDKSSFDFGKLSLKLLEKLKGKELIPGVNCCFSAFISHFYVHLSKSIDSFKMAAIVSVEMGLHHFTTACFTGYFTRSFLSGKLLLKLINDWSECKDVIVHKSKHILSVQQAILNLHDLNVTDPSKLIGEHFNYKSCFDNDGSKFDIPRSSLISSIIAFLFNDYKAASKLLEVCRPLKGYLENGYLVTIFYFYEGLIASISARNAKSKKNSIKTIEEDISRLKEFADDAPVNYAHKVYLLKAELAVVCDKHSEAKSYYHKAISLSEQNGFVNEEAMACERCAMFYLELGLQQDAKKLLLQSHHCYEMWNANTKMRHLVETYPFIKDALKNSSIKDEKYCKILKGSDPVESVSVMSESSSISINTWNEQKRLDYPSTKKKKLELSMLIVCVCSQSSSSNPVMLNLVGYNN